MATRNPDVAYAFSTKAVARQEVSEVMLEIHTGENTWGATLDTEENETLLDMGQSFRVKSIHKDVVIGNRKISRYIVLEFADVSKKGRKTLKSVDQIFSIEKYMTENRKLQIVRRISQAVGVPWDSGDSIYDIAQRLRNRGAWHIAETDFDLYIDDRHKKVVNLKDIAYQYAPHIWV